MLTFIKSSNIFDDRSEVIVCPVNCIGIMGKGLALSFKLKYPKYYETYQRQCKEGKIRLNFIKPYQAANKLIISFPTKNHWRDNSNIDNIEAGILHLISFIIYWKVKSIAIPALGCGLGNLNWNVVKPLFVKYFTDLNCKVYVYEPQ